MTTRDPKTVYIHMANGRKYFPFAPRAEDIDIETIAHHLACAGRWNGATRHPTDPDLIYYSVAEHSVYVSEYLQHELGRPDLALDGLLHDAPEYVIGDLIRPLKYSPELNKPFTRIERLNEAVIFANYQLPPTLHPLVKAADEAVCQAEFEQIVPKDPNEEWESGKVHDSTACAAVQIQMLHPKQARDLFMGRFWTCLGLRHRWKGKVA